MSIRLLMLSLIATFSLHLHSMQQQIPLSLILQAARDGNISIVQQELEKGCSVNEVDQDGQTPLHVACSNGHTEIAEMLLANKAQIEAKTNKGATPLHCACLNGHTKTAEMLLANKAQIEAKDNTGDTPLHLACDNGHTKTAVMLLAKGANIETKDDDGETPLHLACYNGYTETAVMLLAKGTQIEAKDKNGKAPLHYACLDGHTETAVMLLDKGANIEAKDNDGETPLHRACLDGHTATAKMLLAYKAQIEAKDDDGDTPLHHACIEGHTETAEMLLAQGANIEATAINGATPLHRACRNGHKEIVQMLLDKGAQIETKDKNEATLLHHACRNGHKETAEMLLANKAQIEAKDKNGATPLHWACAKGHTEIAKMLLAQGAQIEAKGDNGTTPLNCACRNGHTETAGMLLAKGANIEAKDKKHESTPLHCACHNGHTETVKMLLANKAQTEAKTNDGDTPLHAACSNEDTEIAQMLLDKGAQIEAKDKNGATPLHVACCKGHTEIAQMLVAKGANIEAKTNMGRTPLHHACYNGHTETARMLLENKVQIAQIEAKTNNWDTPLHLACYDGHTEIAQMLVDKGANIEAKNNDAAAPLHLACCKGHTEIAQMLVDKGANIEAKDKNDDTPLHLACGIRHTKTAEMLLDNGAQIEAKDKFKRTPLHFACTDGHTETAQMLLAKKAQIDAKDCEGTTPLHRACYNGHTETAGMLVAKGAQIKAKDKNGDTPLNVACSKRHTEIVKLFSSHLLSTTTSKVILIDTFAHAIESENLEALRLLKNDINKIISKTKNDELLAIRSDEKGNINVRTVDSKTNRNEKITPLLLAIRLNKKEIIHFMIKELGAEVSKVTPAGNNALAEAIKSADIDVITSIANLIKLDDQAYTTCIQLLLRSESIEQENKLNFIKLIVSGMNNLNIPDGEYKTVLDIANEQGLQAIADYLSERGAKKHSTTSSTTTSTSTVYMPAQLIVEETDLGDTQSKINPEQELCLAIDKDDKEKIESVIQSYNIFVNKQLYNGELALNYALKKKRLKAAEALIQLGAIPNIFDSNGATAWSIAIAVGIQSDMFKLLQSQFSNNHYTDGNKNNLMHIIMTQPDKTIVNTMKQVCSAFGHDSCNHMLEQSNINNQTPWQLAAKDVKEWLEKNKFTEVVNEPQVACKRVKTPVIAAAAAAVVQNNSTQPKKAPRYTAPQNSLIEEPIASSSSAPAQGQTAFFGNSDKLETLILDAINQETESISIASTIFTNYAVANAIINAIKNKHISVQIVTDHSGNFCSGKLWQDLRKNGCEIKTTSPDTFMHNKYMICKALGKVFAGSANFTHAGLTQNYENILILNRKDLLQAFADHFQSIFEQAQNLSMQEQKQITEELIEQCAESYDQTLFERIQKKLAQCPELLAHIQKQQQCYSSECSSTTSTTVDNSSKKSSGIFKNRYERILTEINNKTTSAIYIAAYMLSDKQLINALNKTNGMDILILLDDNPSNRALKFSNQFIKVNYYSRPTGQSNPLMHHKFIIAETKNTNPLLYTGSCNFTPEGLRSNDEFMVRESNKTVIDAYKKEFLKLWDLAKSKK